MYDRVEDNDYDANHEDDISQPKMGMLDPIRLRGGGSPIVETVTEEETQEGIEEVEPPPPPPIHHLQIPTTTKKIQPPLQSEYDPMKDKPPPVIITPSYVPLWKKNKH